MTFVERLRGTSTKDFLSGKFDLETALDDFSQALLYLEVACRAERDGRHQGAWLLFKMAEQWELLALRRLHQSARLEQVAA